MTDKSKILDNINQWTQNCDTKASIILATIGIFISMVGTSEITNIAVNLIKLSIKNKTPCTIIYLSILIAGIVLLILGLYKLIRVLVPKLDHTKDSVMFFSHISRFSNADAYKAAFSSKTAEELEDDWLFQIYAASRICSQKFHNQKIGLILSFLGIALIFFWFLVGLLVYYI